ncbi:MAG: DUF1328 domain-containing protein [Dehalococcoidales bacterium]|nr:DUF1328 domain-containing protein [Dehalococcoidales bacterium]
MVGLIVLFLIIAIVTAIFGFGGIVAAATDIALILFWVFLALLVISLLYRVFAHRHW